MAKKLNKLGVENSLWNNIRANKGSGKTPTKEMLKQERKINAKYEEGGTTDKPRFPGNLNVNLVDDTYVKPSVTKDLNIKKQIANSTVPVSNWPTNKNKNAVAKVSTKSNSKFPGKLETNQVDDMYVAPAVSDMRSAEQKKIDYKNYKDSQKLGKSVQNVAIQTALDQVEIPYTSGMKNDRKSIPIGTMINAANDVNDLPSFSNPYLGVINTSLNRIKPKVPVMGDLAVNVLQEGLQRGDEEYATNDFKAKKYLKERGIDPKNIGYIKPFANGGRVLPRFGNGGNKPGTWAGTDRSGKAIKTNFANSTAGENVVTGAGIAGAAVPMLTSFIPDDEVTDSEGNVLGSKVNLGKGALNGAAQGASAFSALGPIGTIAGGIGGALWGAATTASGNSALDAAKRSANIGIGNKNLNTAMTSNKNTYSINDYNNTVQVSAKGGTIVTQDMGNPNAELELNETFRDPITGETGMVDGPSHDNGGIEMSLAEGTQIWSDRLKHNGRTFASLTKPIINKIANIEKGLDTNPNSRFKQNSIKLLNAQLDFFFDKQESNKQQDEMKRTLKKQEGGVVDDMGNYHYANGGIYIKPENRGKFTAYKERTGKTTEEALHSPNANVRQMANFAKNAAGWKHAMGGMVKYDGGGTKDNIGINDGQGRTVVGQINPFTGKPYTVADASNSNFISRGFMDRSPFTKLGPVSYVGNEGNTLLYGKQRPTSFGKPDAPRTMGPMNRPQGYQEPIANQMGPMNRPVGYVDPIQPMQTVENMPAGYDPNAALKSSIKPYYNNADNNYDAMPPAEQQYNFQMSKTGRTNLPVTGAGPGGVNPALFNKANYSNGDYYMNHPTPGGGSSADVTAAYENQRSLDAASQNPNTGQGWFRNNKGELIQAGALAGSAAMQLNNINRLAAPGITPNVNLSGLTSRFKGIDLSAQKNSINQAALSAMRPGQFASSAAQRAFNNKSNTERMRQLAEVNMQEQSYNTEGANKFAMADSENRVKQELINNQIKTGNIENRFNFDQSKMRGQNAAYATLGKGVGDIGRNRTNFSNDMDKANVLSNQYESSVLADVYKRNPQLLEEAWNSGQISKNQYDKYKNQPKAKYGGTIKKRSLKY